MYALKSSNAQGLEEKMRHELWETGRAMLRHCGLLLQPPLALHVQGAGCLGTDAAASAGGACVRVGAGIDIGTCVSM